MTQRRDLETGQWDPQAMSLDASERAVMRYGAGRQSNGTYAALFIGAIIVVGAILFIIGWTGNRTYDQANNPSAKIEGSTATVPGAGTAGQAQPGGNWYTRFNNPGAERMPMTTGQSSQR